MRFALEGSSDDESISSLDYSISSDEEIDLTPSRNPRSTLGRNILTAYDTSEESGLDSEDEVNLGLDDSWDVVKSKDGGGNKKEKVERADVKGKGKGKAKMVSSLSYQVITPRRAVPLRVDDLPDAREDQFEIWLKSADQEAWRDGQKQANARRGEIRNIASNARARMKSQEDSRLEKEADELRKMLEGMTMKNEADERELERKFKEREKKLWDDIEAAIKDVERREAELAAATIAAAQKQKAEDAARKAAAEKLAQEAANKKKAEVERWEREKADKERKIAEQAQEAVKREAAKREEEEAQARAAEEKDKAGSEWRKWVEKQKWMKENVINPVKGDRATKTALKGGMRLMTRGLGQVVNTKEGIIRVTNDLHTILIEQLPSPPSTTSPITLNDDISKPYAYLLSHLAKALIKQAENEVSAKSDAAFPLARIVLGLLLRGHAALGEVLFARFVKKCPWVIPYYPTRQNNQPREEYEKSTGRGSDESVSEYISRMAGICTLYFAILQTPLSSLIPSIGSAPPTPAQLENLIIPVLRFPTSWTWLALALKDPLPGYPPTAHLLSSWLDIVAHEAVRVFGRGQMGKIWEVIEREGLGEGLIKGDSEAARQKLRLTLEKWRLGQFVIPKGRVWE
ncbi:uncharacterized protein I303_102168 [Kwoniella dejecticola CBS 10117]|uniref:mRNA export factor GLE1 n=1 Tax=Kwoniella dejecticola CBS 10117 TaxID=1296121 RepID=A0A1A6ABP3_9TREE|nr:uncharacterized protein I303_01692 [Kwoniella dejecticola CBS 10117]OBR87486.1 hypothetical protein I303_01692 [Kwoniella dejecticola CBS 10117]